MLGFGLLVGGVLIGGQRSTDDGDRIAELRREASDAQTQLVQMRRELTDVNLSKDVDDGANERLRGTIKNLRDEIGNLQEEVLFYKRLMAPSDAKQGLRIERFALERALDNEDVQYSLLLTQIVDRHNWIQGSVEIEIHGMGVNGEQVLALTELEQVDNYPLKFRFRYFQDFNGGVRVPDGFEPEKVMITARTGGSGGTQLQRTFDWKVLEG